MKFFYSPINDSFYPEEFKVNYIKSGTWPIDAIEIPYDKFNEFSLQQSPSNKVRKYLPDIGLYWDNYEVPSSVSTDQERAWRNFELNLSDIELNKVQDSDPNAIGSVSDWRLYRKALRAWPEHINFPDTNFRPISPRNKG